MKSYFLISYLIASLPALALELKYEMGKTMLLASCQEAREQVAQLGSKEIPSCLCDQGVCQTDLTPYLPGRVVEALNTKVTEGPNCYNAVLFAKGVHKKLINNQEMDLYLSSPYCHEIQGPPAAGDIIHVYSNRGDFIIDDHSYLALTDKLAFNKSGPDANQPYEIIRTTDWLDQYKVPASCRFTGVENGLASKCSDIVVAFRCSDLERIRNSNEHQGYSSLTKQIALQALGVPRLNDFPPSVRAHINDILGPEHRDDEKFLDGEHVEIFFLAAPDMNVVKNRAFEKAILEARRLGFYPTLPIEERMMWMNVYSQSLHIDKE